MGLDIGLQLHTWAEMGSGIPVLSVHPDNGTTASIRQCASWSCLLSMHPTPYLSVEPPFAIHGKSFQPPSPACLDQLSL